MQEASRSIEQGISVQEQMSYYINTEADPSSNLVRGFSNNKKASWSPIHIGDKLTIELIFTDGEDGFGWFVGSPEVSVKIGVGKPSSRTELSSAIGVLEGTKYVFELDLDGSGIETELGNELNQFLFIEVQVDEYGGDTRTIHQSQIEVRNEIIK